MKILITRHGQTDWNLQKKVQGQVDIPLNDEGRNEAREIHEKLKSEKIDLIISSPLGRAKETAEIIRGDRDIKITLDERIIERAYGINEGKMRVEFDFAGFWDWDANKNIEEVEKIQDFYSRVYGFLDEIIKEYKDKTILLVSHAGTSIPLRAYLNNVEPKDAAKEVRRLDNCEVDSYDL